MGGPGGLSINVVESLTLRNNHNSNNHMHMVVKHQMHIGILAI